MSFDIFIQTHRDGDFLQFPTAELHKRFAKNIEIDRPGFWRLTFDDGQEHGEVFTDDGEWTSSFMVARPANSLEFWGIIAGILEDYPAILYWPSPDGTRPVVGRLDVIPHLPKDMVETLGVPIVSIDPDYIRRYVWSHS